MIPEADYRTSDLDLASALSAKGHLCSLDKSNPKRVYFVFGISDKLLDDSKNFQNHRLDGDLLDYAQARRQLMKRLQHGD